MAWTHLLRGESLVKKVIGWRMEGKKGRGKPRIMMLDDIKADETHEKFKRRAMDRECWRNWVPRTCFQADRTPMMIMMMRNILAKQKCGKIFFLSLD